MAKRKQLSSEAQGVVDTIFSDAAETIFTELEGEDRVDAVDGLIARLNEFKKTDLEDEVDEDDEDEDLAEDEALED